MAPHSSTLCWKIPWTEEPGRLQSMGSLRVGHDWATSLSLFTFMHWRRKWQPRRIPGTREPGGLQSMGLHRVGHDWSDLAVAVAKTSRGTLFLMPPSDVYVRSFLYLYYTLIKLYYTKVLSHQASSLVPDWIPLLQRPRIPVSFTAQQQPFTSITSHIHNWVLFLL